MSVPPIKHPTGGIPVPPTAAQAEIISLLKELVAEQRQSNQHLKVLADDIRNREIERNSLGHARSIIAENSDD